MTSLLTQIVQASVRITLCVSIYLSNISSALIDETAYRESYLLSLKLFFPKKYRVCIRIRQKESTEKF